MELLEIRYAGGKTAVLEVPDGRDVITVAQWARAIVHVTAGRTTASPAGANDVRLAGGAELPELTEGDEVRWRGRRVMVCAAGRPDGAVIFTSPGPVPPEPGPTAGVADYPAVAPREPLSVPGGTAYPSVRDGRWG